MPPELKVLLFLLGSAATGVSLALAGDFVYRRAARALAAARVREEPAARAAEPPEPLDTPGAVSRYLQR